MKTILSVMLVTLILAAGAMAAQRNQTEIYSTQIHNKSVGTASTAVYSAAVKVQPYTLKTVVFQGYSGATEIAPPGTAVVQCGPASTGPFVTAKDHNGTAASATTNTLFTFEDFCSWYRIGWTKTGTNTKSLSSWLIYGPAN